mmetsp:Transcript_42398/g.51412  ORF Transcript_42398/g.51412 Transcript_42398/m.51412 type:complete len:242 (+) Transcript_42398:399-1124(+)
MGVPVKLQVYDLAHSPNIQSINKFTYGVTGAGGLFHTAVEIYGREYSFGFVERGTGVFSCAPTECEMHSYNHAVSMGEVDLTPDEVSQILNLLAVEWPGSSYDLLKRNCCSFCQEFAERLGVGHMFPGWVVRFANIGASAVDAANNAAETARRVDAAYDISGKTSAAAAAVTDSASLLKKKLEEIDDKHLGGKARETTTAGVTIVKKGLLEIKSAAASSFRGMCVDSPWLFGVVPAAPKQR